eukprot:gene8630-8879_t
MQSTVLCEVVAAQASPKQAGPPAAAAAAVVAEGDRVAAEVERARDADRLRQQESVLRAVESMR